MATLWSIARELLAGEDQAYSARPTPTVISAFRRSRSAERERAELTWKIRNQFFDRTAPR